MTIHIRTQASPLVAVIIGFVFAIIGGFLIYFGYKTSTTNNLKNETYKEIEAKVVAYDYDYSSTDDDMAALIAEYTVDGVKYRVTSNSRSNIPKPIGSTVKIKYNPSNPKQAMFKSDGYGHYIMYGIGGVFLVIGLLVAILNIRKKQNEAL